MLFVRTEEDKLVQFCRHCQFAKSADTSSAVKITETLYSEDDLLYKQSVNKYIRFDPTLPRTCDIKCPVADCPGPKDDPRVIVYKYHPIQMKYFYCCDHCGYSWRMESKK